MPDEETQGGVQPTPAAPDTAAPAAAAPSGTAQPGSWSATAQTAAQPIAQQGEQDASAGMTIPQQQTNTAQTPVVLTQVPHSGMRGFIDKALDSLAGKSTIQPYQDEQGNIYVQHPNMTRGQQWTKIASEGLRGAAAGLAAGKGAGNGGKALEAGVQAGDEMGQAQREREHEQLLEMANGQKLKHDIAAQSFALTRQQVVAQQQDIDFYDKQSDRLTNSGGTLLGTAKDLGQIADIMKNTPGFKEAQVKENRVVPVPNVLPDGTHDGFKVYMMPQGYNSKLVPPGTTFHTYDPIKGEMVEHQTSDWGTQGAIDNYNLTATQQQLKAQQEQAELANKQADTTDKQAGTEEKKATTKKTNAETGAIPVESGLKRAQTIEATANAGKADAEAGKARAETDVEREISGAGGIGGMIDEIGQGKMDTGHLSYLMARKPEILEAVAKKYPDFDRSKVDSYVSAYKDFTSGKTSIALNAGATSLGHLSELQALNTPMSHIPHTPAWTAYQNKATTLATELAKFYGDATIPAIAGIKDSLTSTLPGNRQKAIATQAQSMGDKLDNFEQTWKNAAPSKAYEAPMPGISEKAKDARAALDPKYAQQRVAELQNMAPAQQAQHAGTAGAIQVQPGEYVTTNQQTKQQVVHRNNQWLDVATGQPIPTTPAPAGVQ